MTGKNVFNVKNKINSIFKILVFPQFDEEYKKYLERYQNMDHSSKLFCI